MTSLDGRIWGHRRWASVGLLDGCIALSPTQLDLTTPGTFGMIPGPYGLPAPGPDLWAYDDALESASTRSG